MPLIVFEEDPLVRDDISETLNGVFARYPVVVCETADALRASISETAKPCIVVVSLPDGSAQSDLDSFLSDPHVSGAIVITNTSKGRYRLPPNCFALQRPFSSDLLLNATKTVLSGLPEAQS